MENLRAIAIFPKIESSNLANFKTLAAELITAVSAQKSILRYDLFFTADESSCVVLEEYETAQAVIDHVQANSELLGKLMELGGKIEGQIFPLSQAGPAISLIRQEWDSTIHFHFAGK